MYDLYCIVLSKENFYGGLKSNSCMTFSDWTYFTFMDLINCETIMTHLSAGNAKRVWFYIDLFPIKDILNISRTLFASLQNGKKNHSLHRVIILKLDYL